MAMGPGNKRSDAELLVASRSDPEAFCELYDRWAGPLLGFFYQRVGDADTAGDLMAETVAVIFEKRDRFRDQGQPGSAWIFTLAARQLSHYRRRKVVERRAVERLGWTVPALDSESITAIEALLDSDERGDLLQQALLQLPAGERDAVQLRVISELGYSEIATQLSCSVVAARVRVHRGLARMNKAIGSVQ